MSTISKYSMLCKAFSQVLSYRTSPLGGSSGRGWCSCYWGQRYDPFLGSFRLELAGGDGVPPTGSSGTGTRQLLGDGNDKSASQGAQVRGGDDLCEILKTFSAWSLERNDVSSAFVVSQDAFQCSIHWLNYPQ